MGFTVRRELPDLPAPGAQVRGNADRERFSLTKLWFSVTQASSARGSRSARSTRSAGGSSPRWTSSRSNRWEAYTAAKEAMVLATDTDEAPWTSIKSNDKKRARINAMRFFPQPVRLRGQGHLGRLSADPKIVKRPGTRSRLTAGVTTTTSSSSAAGAGGSVVAARLSEDPDRSVLVLEAGDAPRSRADYPPELLDAAVVPGAAPTAGRHWPYPVQLTDRQATTIFRGRVLGGCSATNGGYFIPRGPRTSTTGRPPATRPGRTSGCCRSCARWNAIWTSADQTCTVGAARPGPRPARHRADRAAVSHRPPQTSGSWPSRTRTPRANRVSGPVPR